MSEDAKSVGQIVLGWWAVNIGARDTAHARGLSARLRRAGKIEMLSEKAVQDLALALGARPAQAEKLIRLVGALSEVRDTAAAPLARILGDGAFSELRFQKLMRAEGDEFDALLRRAIQMADRRGNVAALADDLWHWGEDRRTRWCFHYFGADAPTQDSKETTQ